MWNKVRKQQILDNLSRHGEIVVTTASAERDMLAEIDRLTKLVNKKTHSKLICKCERKSDDSYSQWTDKSNCPIHRILE